MQGEKEGISGASTFSVSHCILEKNLSLVAMGNWDYEQNFNASCKAGYFGQFLALDFVCNVGYPRQLVAVKAKNGRFKNASINHKVQNVQEICDASVKQIAQF